MSNQRLNKQFSTKKYTQSVTEKVLEKYQTTMPLPPENEGANYYFIKIISECNLKCALCAFGSKSCFQRETCKMSLELFTKILDKIKIESPSARISPYCFCEPTLHPLLPEMIKAIKKRVFLAEVSTNLNNFSRIENLIKAQPDELAISVSGFFQEIYGKSHANGDIENVKQNMFALRKIIDTLGSKTQVNVIYHMYKDNLEEDFDKMKHLTEILHFGFMPAWARSINVELNLQYLRKLGHTRYTGETYSWFNELKPVQDAYTNILERILYKPEDYLEGEWADIHLDVCPYNYRMVNIKANGKVNLCPNAFDDRNVGFDYLTSSLEDLYTLREKNLICKECLANN